MQNAINTIMNNPDQAFEDLIPALNIRASPKSLMHRIFAATVHQCFSANTTPAQASYDLTIEVMKDLGLLQKDASAGDVIAKNINS